MADPTAEFFDDLARRGFDARLGTVTGTIGFDLDDGEDHSHWVVAIDRGHIAVSAEPRTADCVLHATRAQFNAIILGQDSALAAMFRGATTTEGNLQLLLYFERLLPAAAGARDPRDRRPAAWKGGKG